ncbi:Fc.00g003610.m01.CDS01 [Cosmosporella sp. VM-42]
MRITTTSTEDNGLSDSAYELVSGTDTEEWSEDPDGIYTESISDSVASLDLHRPDDVHSLAGTEQTYDDESIAESEPYIQPTLNPPEEEQHGTTEHEPTQAPETEVESDDEEDSRSSIEYTRQNLSTPSIPTPEASGIVERPAEPTPAAEAHDDAGGLLAQSKKWLAETWEVARVRAIPRLLTINAVVLTLSFIVAAVWLQNPQPGSVVTQVPAVAPVVVTSTPSVLAISSSKAPTPQALATTVSTAGLVPLENVSDEWLFATKKPELFMSKHQGDYLIHINPPIKYQCLEIVAQRGSEPVQVNVSPVEKGILIRFPYKESHGTVRVLVASSCRPKIKQILEIPFGDRGIVEEALDLARHLAQDISECVPVAAQEAERRIEEAKRSLESASGNAMLASDNLFKALSTRFQHAHRSLGHIKADARDRMQNARDQLSKQISGVTDQVMQQLPDPRDLQEQAQLGLLDAQLSAKIWWLKMTGAKDMHDSYKRKAKDLMGLKKAEASYARQFRHNADKSWMKPDMWSRIFREGRCRRKSGRGLKEAHQCDFLA